MTPEGEIWMREQSRKDDEVRLATIAAHVEAGVGRDHAVLLVDQEATLERMPIVEQLRAADPKLGELSAFVIAGDMLTLERSKQWVRDGCPAEDAMIFVGSYGRLEFGAWAVEEAFMEEAVLLERLPDLWRGSDPDDTDPRWLSLWRKAWAANGHRTVRDGKHLPKGHTLKAYRGQDADAPLGIAWSLDQKVAEKFAMGAGTRQSNRGGMIFETEVPRTAVLAYLTGRNESEVILPTIGRDFDRKEA